MSSSAPEGTSRVLGAGGAVGVRVCLAHGLEDTWSSWRGLSAHLPPDWRVDALDLPWRSGTDYDWRFRNGAPDLLAAAMTTPPDLLVAHSFAAVAALELLAAGALTATEVVLVCPLYCPSQTRITWDLLDQANRRFVAHLREGVLARVHDRSEVIDPEVMDSMTRCVVERVGIMGLLAMFDRYVASSRIPLETIGHRTLVYAGGRDRTLTVAAAQELAHRMPHTQLVVEEDHDHFPHIRHPGRLAQRITAFVGMPRRWPAAVPDGTGEAPAP